MICICRSILWIYIYFLTANSVEYELHTIGAWARRCRLIDAFWIGSVFFLLFILFHCIGRVCEWCRSNWLQISCVCVCKCTESTRNRIVYFIVNFLLFKLNVINCIQYDMRFYFSFYCGSDDISERETFFVVFSSSFSSLASHNLKL